MARKRAHVNTSYWTTTALIAWVVVVFFMHIVPVDPEKARSIQIPHFDKLVHFTLFFVLSILAIQRRFTHNNATSKWVFARIILLCCAYGIALEWIQPLMGTHRSSDLLDGAADATGVMLGAFCFRDFRRLFLFSH